MRARIRPGVKLGLAAAALAAALLVGTIPAADATPTRADALIALLNSPAAPNRKAVAIEELRTIDSTQARQALRDLADDADDRLAMLAISAVGRADTSGGRTKLRGVYEDSERSDVVRATALTAYLRLCKMDGDSWADRRTWVRDTAGSNTHLCDAYAALKAKWWPREADDTGGGR